MRVREFGSLAFLFLLTFLVMGVFATLQYLHLTVGTLLDWLIGLAIVWWLTGITTLPWNMHFAAKHVLDEARQSREKGMRVNEPDVAYAAKLTRRFWWLAIGLHVVSAVGLYLLSYYQVTPIGYLASLAAVLLTFVRPLQRLYEYIAARLTRITNEVRYPRDDAYELKQTVTQLESTVESLTNQLDQTRPESWAWQQSNQLSQLRAEVARLGESLRYLAEQNTQQHELLSRKAETEIARLSEDAQFLNQVRELIRFFKQA